MIPFAVVEEFVFCLNFHAQYSTACLLASVSGRAAFQLNGGGDGGGGDDGNGACNLLRLIAGGILLGVDFCRLCVWLCSYEW